MLLYDGLLVSAPARDVHLPVVCTTSRGDQAMVTPSLITALPFPHFATYAPFQTISFLHHHEYSSQTPGATSASLFTETEPRHASIFEELYLVPARVSFSQDKKNLSPLLMRDVGLFPTIWYVCISFEYSHNRLCQSRVV